MWNREEEQLYVPQFMLQPIMENAVVHAFGDASRGVPDHDPRISGGRKSFLSELRIMEKECPGRSWKSCLSPWRGMLLQKKI